MKTFFSSQVVSVSKKENFPLCYIQLCQSLLIKIFLKILSKKWCLNFNHPYWAGLKSNLYNLVLVKNGSPQLFNLWTS